MAHQVSSPKATDTTDAIDPARVVDDVTNAIASYVDELAADRAALVLHLQRLPGGSAEATLAALRDEHRTFRRLARKIRAREWIAKLCP